MGLPLRAVNPLPLRAVNPLPLRAVNPLRRGSQSGEPQHQKNKYQHSNNGNTHKPLRSQTSEQRPPKEKLRPEEDHVVTHELSKKKAGMGNLIEFVKSYSISFKSGQNLANQLLCKIEMIVSLFGTSKVNFLKQ